MQLTDKLNNEDIIERWFQELEQNNVLTKSIRNEKEYYHLNSPIKFVYPQIQIDNLLSKYHPKREEGGYILFRQDIRNSNMVLKAVDVKWIDNTSATPENSYNINTSEHIRIEREAYLNQLFPIRFHTHPMDVEDIPRQSDRRLEIIDTSDSDKRISFDFPFKTLSRTVILPDVLIVWDVKYLNSFFIGTYNGLIAPIGFIKHRLKLTEKYNKEMQESIYEWVDEKSNFVKGALIVGTITAFFAGSYFAPYLTGQLIKDVKNQNSISAIGSQRGNVYFGFTNSKFFSDFTITIPRVTQTITEDNEQEIKFVMERIREK
jgi:hypothetical protein